MNREQRDALLLGDWNSASGGGQPLPEALRAVLSYLYENGFTATSVLHKVIREQDVVAFKDTRILEVWKTWESFCNAILDVLRDGKFISGSFGDGWIITEKAVPGRVLTVIRIADGERDRRTRVTFHSEHDRRMRNEMQVVKNGVDSLLTQVNRTKGSHLVYEKVNQYLLACTQLLREALNGGGGAEQEEGSEEESPVPFRSLPSTRATGHRKPGVIQRWIYDYLMAHPGQLISVKDLTSGYNAYDAENIQSGRVKEIHSGVVNQAIDRLTRHHPGSRVEWVREDVRYISIVYTPAPE